MFSIVQDILAIVPTVNMGEKGCREKKKNVRNSGSVKVSPAFLSLASASKDGIPGINLVFVSNLLEPVL